MSVPAPGAIDCDIHPALPSMQVLVPYFDEYWRSHVLMRGLERDNYTASAFPPNAPINCRPDWKPEQGSGGTDIDMLRSQALDAFGTRYAICNGVQRGSVRRDVPCDQRLARRRVAVAR